MNAPGDMTPWLVAATAAALAVTGLAGAFLYWRLAYFLRDPPRVIPADETAVLAAADGFITYVKRVEDGQVPVAVKARTRIPLREYVGVNNRASGYLIGTYMTEHSVHRNRAPVSGEVVYREHRSAAPFNRSMARMTANLLFRRQPYDDGCEYLLTNERLTIAIALPDGSLVLVTQIADLWINRIIARVEVGERVQRGQQYGLIRFGSQCDVFLPDNVVDTILVQAGQYVLAGETVLARARTAAPRPTAR